LRLFADGTNVFISGLADNETIMKNRVLIQSANSKFRKTCYTQYLVDM